MKVFVVYNEALHPQSSYHHIDGVFSTRKDAINAIECSVYDFYQGIDRGDFPSFVNCTCDHENPLWDMIVETEEGYYEAWRIHERVLNEPTKMD